MTITPESTTALDGLAVVDLTSGIAGAYCTRLLADLGAAVTMVEPPEGNPLRSWSASGTPIESGDDGPLFHHLASSKRSVVVDPRGDLGTLQRLLADAAVIVWSPGPLTDVVAALEPAAIQAAAPSATVVAISPFGCSGPWRDRPATEFTIQAWSGGVIGLGRGDPQRPPVSIGGSVTEWITGAYAAFGALASRRRTGGSGELVDVSMLEVAATSLTYFPVTFAEIAGRPFRTGRSLVTPGVETTSDGCVGLGVGTGQQWLDFAVMVGHPEWAEDRRLFAQRSHLAGEIAAWTTQRTTDEILELAAAFRIPHAPIGNGATIPCTGHFVARRCVVRNPRDEFVEPAPAHRFDPPLHATRTPAPRLGEHTDAGVVAGGAPEGAPPEALTSSGELPFSGIRVLDLTSFWAGPLAGHLLATLGAEVIHVESTARPDGTRMLAGLRFSEPNWWERSGIFAGLNTNKQSLTLDLSTARGRELCVELAGTCDVIIENFTPRVMDHLGLDLEALRAARPDLIVVRMPGFGLDGPWRDNPAFAFVIEDAAGLTWMTGPPDANPVSPYCVGDSNAGVHAALGVTAALAHRDRSGTGALVESSMLDAALAVAAEQVVEYSATGTLLGRDANRGPVAAPQNLYLAADLDADGTRDTWVALGVRDDAQWRALSRALGAPAWAVDPRFDHAEGRHRHHDEIDGHLAEWCASRPADEIVDTWWAAGVAVARVIEPHEQRSVPQLVERDFWEMVDHPVAGPAHHPRPPLRFSAGPDRFHRRHAPLLGEHSASLLAEIGVSTDEIVRLATEGIIGDRPR